MLNRNSLLEGGGLEDTGMIFEKEVTEKEDSHLLEILLITRETLV